MVEISRGKNAFEDRFPGFVGRFRERGLRRR